MKIIPKDTWTVVEGNECDFDVSDGQQLCTLTL